MLQVIGSESGEQYPLSYFGRTCDKNVLTGEPRTLLVCFKIICHTIVRVCSVTWVVSACLTPCNPMDCSPPGSFGHGIPQARILEWVAMPSSRGSSWCRNQTHISCIPVRSLDIFAYKLIKHLVRWYPVFRK